MSRGFTPNHAKSLIVEGFLVNSFSKIDNNEVSTFLLDALNAHLSKALEA